MHGTTLPIYRPRNMFIHPGYSIYIPSHSNIDMNVNVT